MNMKIVYALIGVGVLAAAGAGVYFFLRYRKQNADPAAPPAAPGPAGRASADVSGSTSASFNSVSTSDITLEASTTPNKWAAHGANGVYAYTTTTADGKQVYTRKTGQPLLLLHGSQGGVSVYAALAGHPQTPNKSAIQWSTGDIRDTGVLLQDGRVLSARPPVAKQTSIKLSNRGSDKSINGVYTFNGVQADGRVTFAQGDSLVLAYTPTTAVWQLLTKDNGFDAAQPKWSSVTPGGVLYAQNGVIVSNT